MRPVATIDACRVSHQRLLGDLASLTDTDFRSSSMLPGWSRGHVVSHVANKTRAHVWLFGGPVAGEVRRQFPVGFDTDAAAAIGASRSATEIRSDLQESFENLEAAWDALDDDLWDSQGIMAAGPRTMTEIVSQHLRNVEVHHADLGIGYTPSDWPVIFVDGELVKRLRDLPDRVDHADLLAWLLGRAPAPELGPW